MREKNVVWVEIENVSDVDVRLERKPGTPWITLPARATSLVKIPTTTPSEPMELSCTATNFLIGPEKGLPVTLRIAGE